MSGAIEICFDEQVIILFASCSTRMCMNMYTMSMVEWDHTFQNICKCLKYRNVFNMSAKTFFGHLGAVANVRQR